MFPNLAALPNLGQGPELLHLSLCMQLVWFPAKSAGLQGSHTSSSCGNRPKNPALVHISRQGHFLWAMRACISENPVREKDGRQKAGEAVKQLLNHSQDSTVTFPQAWRWLKRPVDPRTCNFHFYSNLILTIKLTPLLDFHWKPQTMNQKP